MRNVWKLLAWWVLYAALYIFGVQAMRGETYTAFYSGSGTSSDVTLTINMTTGVYSAVTHVAAWGTGPGGPFPSHAKMEIANNVAFTSGVVEAFHPVGPGTGATVTGNYTGTVTPGKYFRLGVCAATPAGPPVGGSWTYGSAYQVAGTNDKYRVSGTNGTQVAVKYVVTSVQTGEVLWDSGAIPMGGSYDSGVKIMPAGTSSITVMAFTQFDFRDGVWVELPTMTGGGSTSGPHSGGTGSPGIPGPTPPGPGGPAPTPGGNGNQPWIPTGGGTDTSDLVDKSTFRQGIDKLEAAIGSGEAAFTLNNTDPTLVTTAAVLPKPADVANLLPVTPSFFSGSVGSTSVVSATIPGFTLAGKTWPAYAWSFNFNKFAATITIVRTALQVGLWVGFFLLLVRTARESSAK